MRTYPLLTGEVAKDSFVVDFDPTVHNVLETKCREEWKELFKISPKLQTASPYVPYDIWSASQEGRTHKWLMNYQFAVTGVINGHPAQPYTIWVSHDEYVRILSSIQARRRHVGGPRKTFANGHQNLKAYRQFRSWWISKHLAEVLGVSFKTPCPISRTNLGLPVLDYIEIGKNFEEWSGYPLTPKLWVWLKEMEAERRDKLQAEQDDTITDQSTLQAA